MTLNKNGYLESYYKGEELQYLKNFIQKGNTINDFYNRLVKTINFLSMQKIPLENNLTLKYNNCIPIWKANMNCYEIKIGEEVIRGNIGDIYEDSSLIRKGTKRCKERKNCSFLNSGKPCNFYHDPKEIIEMKKNNIISSSLKDEQLLRIRNFKRSDFIYHPNKRHGKLIGSRNRLKYDLFYITQNRMKYIKDMEDQLAHEILLFLYVKNNM